jgi:hypothetical protein
MSVTRTRKDNFFVQVCIHANLHQFACCVCVHANRTSCSPAVIGRQRSSQNQLQSKLLLKAGTWNLVLIRDRHIYLVSSIPLPFCILHARSSYITYLLFSLHESTAVHSDGPGIKAAVFSVSWLTVSLIIRIQSSSQVFVT